MDQTELPTDGPAPSREDTATLHVVGIGASAGGLAAFRAFLEAAPARSGMAYVLVQHLDPDHPSLMAGLLAQHTDMPVVEVTEAMPLEPDRVYVTPPDRYLRVEKDTLYPQASAGERGVRMPIDHFFRSLAGARRERAICIVLTGTGSDGALGLREVKAAGGLIVVQQPETAEYEGMPRSATATGLADFVLPIEEMPVVLARYVRHSYVASDAGADLDEEAPDQFQDILDLLRARTAHDFRGYKRTTLNRRIQRRMGLLHVGTLGEYVQLLREDPREVERLFGDLLIGVTRFFRDPERWVALEQALADVVARRATDGAPLRAWVPGCASGEEVYSLAILLSDLQERRGLRLAPSLFGTDLDARAIAAARVGVYPEGIAEDVDDDRLERHFDRVADGFRVSEHLRKSAIFATQNLASDPPFSNLDLIACRNVMIYLEPPLQRRLVETFHFALRPGGLLFVGPSESIGRQEHLFEPVSTTHRIYRRSDGPTRRLPNVAMTRVPARRTGRVETAPWSPPDDLPDDLPDVATRALLEEFAPPAALVDVHGQILHVHGRLRDYLDFPSGELPRDVAALAMNGLRAKLRAALHAAARDRKRTEVLAPRVRRDGATVAVRVTVCPAGARRAGEVFLVAFEDVPAAAPPSSVEPAGDARDEDDERVAQLQHELEVVREDLQSTIEELETSNEELMASSEEVLSTNEELQSTNEELATSKEELQSLNEELSTVNSQLEDKVGLLEATNNDLANLLASTQIATIFLDTELRIRRFTPATTELLHVIDTDVGRPITDLVARVRDQDLLEDARGVLKRLQPSERQLEAGGGRTFLRRILPYRTEDQRIDGVVVTFTNVTELSETRRRVESRERQQALVAELGRRALSAEGIDELLEDAVRKVAGGLGVGLAKVLELLPSRELLLRSGVGWREGLVGTARVAPGMSQAGFTLQSMRPVVVEDLETEQRFHGPPLLLEHGVRAGMSVVIGTVEQPWGVLGAHATEPRSFTMDDVHFLETVANVLADAIARHQVDEQLRRRAYEMSLLFQATSSGATTFDDALQACIDAVCELTGHRIGHAYVRAPDGSRFVSSGIWHVDDVEGTTELRERTASDSIRRGEGFIGAIWATREPREVTELAEDESLRHLSDLGVQGAFGFPVIVQDEVAAILQFFTTDPVHAEHDPIAIVRSLGEQVGRVYERNRAAKRLEESAERLDLALEAGELGAFEWDLDSGEVAWNEQHFRILGYDPETVPASYDLWFQRVHPEDRERVARELRSAEERHAPFECEYRLLLPDGRVRWVQGKGDRLRGRDGGKRRMYGVLIDVTERLHMEAGLREADRRKDAFLATLGHELRNPLGAVANGIQLLRGAEDASQQTQEVTAMMDRQVRLIANLLNDLLDVGRISRGGIALSPQRLELAEHVRQAVETVCGDVESGGHDVTVSIEPPDLTVVADPVRLEQVLVNLLSNAARYTPAPGSIEVQGRRVGERVRLAVRDSGIGLDSAEMREIFEPFYQVKKGSGGLGIGLSLVRRLVELHGGRVHVASEGHGRGSTFTVALPAGEDTGERAPPAPEAVSTECLAALRVLAIDDHEESLNALAALLAKRCQVATATTAEAGLAEARRFRPHVALIDLALPDRSGFEVLGELRRDPATAEALHVAVTGFGDVPTEASIADAGFDEHILKPIDFDALLALLHRAARAVPG